MSALLQTTDLTVTYGGVRAVDAVSLSVPQGALVGLIGPNGAGKTTFIDAVCGFVPAVGSVALDGSPLDDLPPHRRTRRGLVRTFQSVELFDDLDVLGNLLVAAERPAWWRPLADLARPGRGGQVPDGVTRAIRLTAIGHLVGRATSELSEGERKLVGLCRALVGSPRVVLLDEPAAGLDTAESRALGERLQLVVADGVTVVLVDHDMDLVLGVCDLVHVIERGRLIASGPPAEIRRDPTVVRAYLGTGASA